MKPLRVAVDARLVPGRSGGVETVVRGLAQGLGELDLAGVEVCFVVLPGQGHWLAAALGASCRVLDAPRRSPSHQVSRGFSRSARVAAYRAGLRSLPARLALPGDPGMDALRPDVVHYPFQQFGVPAAPFIWHPHDLQHLYFPEFFTTSELAHRTFGYRGMCDRAALVGVGTRWVKQDVVGRLGVPPEKVSVVALAATREHVVPDESVRSRLPARYLLYPAANWPHKNHARFIEALAMTDRSARIHVVLTGPVSSRFPDPAELAAGAGVAERVHSLGYLSAGQLDVVYRGASGVVVPTLFEAASFPVWEAFTRGIPVACSNVTSLPEQVGDAALLFDPDDARQMAATIERIWGDRELARRLGAAGQARVATFTWARTARRFLARYRQLAGAMTDADLGLLGDDAFAPVAGGSSEGSR
jgi:glycosyltransferase involved in cell wall biosynthesis